MPHTRTTTVRWSMLTLALTAAGCASVGGGDPTVDYRTQAPKTVSLDVPPDLTQLATDSRFVVSSSSSVSAARFGAPAKAGETTASTAVAPSQRGGVQWVRDGQARWLVTAVAPEAVFPRLRSFLTDMGLSVVQDQPEWGLLETDWAENRAKLPQDFIRATLGRVIDKLYDSGERDRYRIRVERGPQGTEIYLTHQGLIEQQVGPDRLQWRPRPADLQLEAEMLARLMAYLTQDPAAATPAAARPQPAPAATVAAATQTLPERARLVPGDDLVLALDDSPERAWRRLGLSLDRAGFTIEARDRVATRYSVRFIDPNPAAKNQDSFSNVIARLVGLAPEPEPPHSGQFTLQVQADGPQGSRIAVLTPTGQPDRSRNARQLAQRLLEDLR